MVILALAALVALAIHAFVLRLLNRFVGKQQPYVASVIAGTRGLTRLAFLVVALIVALPVAPFDRDVDVWLGHLLLVAGIGLVGWIAITASHIVAERYLRRFRLDEPDNLLARTEESALGTATVELPLDASGRNRPGSVDGVPLAWDASGNLVAKGDLTLHYDFRNRLTRVDGPSGELVSYAYDALNRRVRRTEGGVVTETVWDGWQPIEEYENGQLVERRTYGVGLDELLWVERDADGNGSLEASWFPIFDATGNVAMVVDGNGRPTEAYEYSPYGERIVRVNDLTPPVVEQVRVVGEAARPQALAYRQEMTLLDVMIAVGGITDFADGNGAQLLRTSEGNKLYSVRLRDLLRRGDLTANVDVKPGDILVIPQSWF